MNLLIGVSVASLIGTNVITRATNAVVQKGIDTLSFIKCGSSSYEKIIDALRKIEELDIKIKIKVLQKFINSKADTKNQLDIYEDLEDIIKKCCFIIDKITTAIKDQDAKWLKRYRSFDVEQDLIDLELYNTIIKNRIELFILENDM